MAAPTTLDGFLKVFAGADPLRTAIARTVLEVAEAGRQLRIVAENGSDGEIVATGVNADGDRQVELDVIADRMFQAAARRAPVAAYASEEEAEPIPIDSKQPLALAIDPLDGSSNVDLNLSFGTIFSILPALPTNGGALLDSFLQPGSRLLAAGLLIYGPRLTLVVSLGEGTYCFSHGGKPADYRLVGGPVTVPSLACEFAINASNYRHWDDGVRLYFDDCVKGVHGPRERDFNMRWLASLVVEAYRILIRGGVFLYPADRRAGYGNGRLRLVYEANPVAFLMEQAGGSATDGARTILSVTPQSLHQRTPLIFGSNREVAKLTRYHTEPSTIAERSPLFGHRSLFRM